MVDFSTDKRLHAIMEYTRFEAWTEENWVCVGMNIRPKNWKPQKHGIIRSVSKTQGIIEASYWYNLKHGLFRQIYLKDGAIMIAINVYDYGERVASVKVDENLSIVEDFWQIDSGMLNIDSKEWHNQIDDLFECTDKITDPKHICCHSRKLKPEQKQPCAIWFRN